MADAKEKLTRLEQLQKKRDQINAQIKSIKATESKAERKKETRRKIITGAIARNHAEMHPNSDFTKELNKLLNQHVDKPADRELLELSPLTGQFSEAQNQT